MQMLAANRLSEVQDAKEENRILLEQFQELQVYKVENLLFATDINAISDIFFKIIYKLNITVDIVFSQNEVKDDKYVHSSRLYTMRNDQLQHWNAEVEQYKGLTDALQVKLPCFMCLHSQMFSIFALCQCF